MTDNMHTIKKQLDGFREFLVFQKTHGDHVEHTDYIDGWETSASNTLRKFDAVFSYPDGDVVRKKKSRELCGACLLDENPYCLDICENCPFVDELRDKQ